MNNNKRLTSVFLVLGMVAAAPLAFAQSVPTQQKAEDRTTEATQAPPAEHVAEAVADEASAPAAASGPRMAWKDLDTDGDGNISLEEARRHDALASVFGEVDTNADGQLSVDEYRAYAERQQARAAQRQD